MDFNATIFSLKRHIFLASAICALSCSPQSVTTDTFVDAGQDSVAEATINIVDSVVDAVSGAEEDTVLTYYRMLEGIGAVNIDSIDPSIIVELKYSGSDNFLSRDLYGAATRAYLQKDAAEALALAQSKLKDIDTTLSLVVYDAIRPLSVQRDMWETFDVDNEIKQKFLSKPTSISMHNLGFAVDVSIRMSDGNDLDMGTVFDDYSELSYPCLEYYFSKRGLIGYNHINNRSILRFVMELAGFTQNKYEWWHFYFSTKAHALAHYPIVEDFKSYRLPSKVSPAFAVERVVFSVQLAASVQRLSLQSLCFKDSKEYRHEGMYKYCAGEFKYLESAYQFRDSLLSTACKSAFVVSFYNGERIPIQKALSLMETE